MTLNTGSERVFRFYQLYIRENSPERKRATTQYNTAQLLQTRPDTAESMHRHTARGVLDRDMVQVGS